MSQTLVTAGQSLVDVAVQEFGSIEALFDLADANGAALTDVLVPGQLLSVPTSPNGQADVAAYFQARAYRVNTGAETPLIKLRRPDFNQTDFQPLDFS